MRLAVGPLRRTLDTAPARGPRGLELKEPSSVFHMQDPRAVSVRTVLPWGLPGASAGNDRTCSHNAANRSLVAACDISSMTSSASECFFVPS